MALSKGASRYGEKSNLTTSARLSQGGGKVTSAANTARNSSGNQWYKPSELKKEKPSSPTESVTRELKNKTEQVNKPKGNGLPKDTSVGITPPKTVQARTQVGGVGPVEPKITTTLGSDTPTSVKLAGGGKAVYNPRTKEYDLFAGKGSTSADMERSKSDFARFKEGRAKKGM